MQTLNIFVALDLLPDFGASAAATPPAAAAAAAATAQKTAATAATPALKGVLAFLLWRAAYWTKQVSLQNKMLIPMHWLKSLLFGRDISRF